MVSTGCFLILSPFVDVFVILDFFSSLPLSFSLLFNWYLNQENSFFPLIVSTIANLRMLGSTWSICKYGKVDETSVSYSIVSALIFLSPLSPFSICFVQEMLTMSGWQPSLDLVTVLLTARSQMIDVELFFIISLSLSVFLLFSKDRNRKHLVYFFFIFFWLWKKLRMEPFESIYANRVKFALITSLTKCTLSITLGATSNGLRDSIIGILPVCEKDEVNKTRTYPVHRWKLNVNRKIKLKNMTLEGDKALPPKKKIPVYFFEIRFPCSSIIFDWCTSLQKFFTRKFTLLSIPYSVLILSIFAFSLFFFLLEIIFISKQIQD